MFRLTQSIHLGRRERAQQVSLSITRGLINFHDIPNNEWLSVFKVSKLYGSIEEANKVEQGANGKEKMYLQWILSTPCFGPSDHFKYSVVITNRIDGSKSYVWSACEILCQYQNTTNDEEVIKVKFFMYMGVTPPLGKVNQTYVRFSEDLLFMMKMINLLPRKSDEKVLCRLQNSMVGSYGNHVSPCPLFKGESSLTSGYWI